MSCGTDVLCRSTFFGIVRLLYVAKTFHSSSPFPSPSSSPSPPSSPSPSFPHPFLSPPTTTTNAPIAAYFNPHVVSRTGAAPEFWTTVEVCLGVVAACLPPLGPLLRKLPGPIRLYHSFASGLSAFRHELGSGSRSSEKSGSKRSGGWSDGSGGTGGGGGEDTAATTPVAVAAPGTGNCCPRNRKSRSGGSP